MGREKEKKGRGSKTKGKVKGGEKGKEGKREWGKEEERKGEQGWGEMVPHFLVQSDASACQPVIYIREE